MKLGSARMSGSLSRVDALMGRNRLRQGVEMGQRQKPQTPDHVQRAARARVSLHATERRRCPRRCSQPF